MIAQQAANMVGQALSPASRGDTTRIRRERRSDIDLVRGEEGRSLKGSTRLVVRRSGRRRHRQGWEQRFNRTADQRREALDLAFSDTSRELQARFLANHGGPTKPVSRLGRLSWMRDTLKGMLNTELHQWEEGATYRRMQYRAMIQALSSPPKNQAERSSLLTGSALEQALARAQATHRLIEGQEYLGQNLALVV